VNKAAFMRSILDRITAGEFDLGKADFHRFVVKEIYPRLADGTLTVADFQHITQHFSTRNDPYNHGAESAVSPERMH
jgi:hypothetical protein